MEERSRRRVLWTRAILSYLCLLSVFSSFLVCVHLSLQEKRCSYVMADLLDEKLQLQREVSVARARVEELMRLERLERLCREGKLPLSPPTLPPLYLGSSQDAVQAPGDKESITPSSLEWGGLAMVEPAGKTGGED